MEYLRFNWGASEAIGLRCNVTSWEDQVDLFQTAFDTFGSVDVVVRREPRRPRTHHDPLFIGRERWGK